MAALWPPDYTKEFIRRLRMLEKLKSDPQLQQAFILHYKNNFVDWLQDWCITYDPRKMAPDPKVMPFILFDKQIEFSEFLLDCFFTRQSGLTEKSRDIGASWLCCAFSVWLWRFHNDVTIGWGSRKEEYVDQRGDLKALFPKMRMIIDHMPSWQKPKGFSLKSHAPYMRILNPENGSSIIGEAGDNIGRGGRTSIYFKDESAHYEHAESIEAALGDNTDVQIDISSVNGTANVFYRRRMAGDIWHRGHEIPRGKVRVFIFDWKDHPGKTLEWYEERKRRAEDEGLAHIFAQEVDRDYSGALDRIIIPPEWVRAAIDAHVKLGWDPSGRRIAGQDVADEGGDKNALVIRHGSVLIYADHWGGEAGEAAKRAVPICVEYGVDELFYDSPGVGSGFKTQINVMKEWESWPQKLRVFPWNGGSTPLQPEERSIPGDFSSPLNKDQYKNLKAQSWFRTRARFYKTFQALNHGAKFDPDEMISIDSKIKNLHQLTLEFSQAVSKQSTNGKTLVDKKPEGATSPNLADAAVQSYNPSREVSILDVL